MLELRQKARASFTTPNATCPVCGALVFFYQNDFGSRVYFDDLGPPWPKHPCTDNEPDRVDGLGRRPKVIVRINRRIQFKPILTEAEPEDAEPKDDKVDEVQVSALRTIDGWDRCTAKKRSDREAISYFVVTNASDPSHRSIRFSTALREDLPTTGETLFLKGELMSFFSFDEFAPQEVPIERKRSKAVSSSRKRKARRRNRRK